MNKFDYLKLELPSSAVSITDPGVFSHTISKDGVETHMKFKQKSPYGLEIIVDVLRNRTYLSFSGKILFDNYPYLINVSNIQQCFDNINKTNICYINKLTAINTAIVTQCDITTDIPFTGNVKELLQSIMLKSEHTVCKKSSNRFYISNTYVTPRKKTTMVVYDKAEELRTSSNRPFLDSVNNKSELLDYFSDKLRIEINLRSVDRIRKYFNREDTRLLSLLTSTSDPIAHFLNESICSDEVIDCLIAKAPKLRDLEHLLLLCMCGFDLKKVEKVVRSTTAKAGSITNHMKPYRAIYQRIISEGIDPNLDIDFSAIHAQINYAITKVLNPCGSEVKQSLPLLYANTNKASTPCECDPLFLFNIPTVILPVLPD